jgi:hypothetical protein
VEKLQLQESALFLNGLVAVSLPIFLVGGGFKHGQHLAFDTENNYLQTKLYVTVLQRLGMEVDSFSSSTGTMTGLEVA